MTWRALVGEIVGYVTDLDAEAQVRVVDVDPETNVFRGAKYIPVTRLKAPLGAYSPASICVYQSDIDSQAQVDN